MGGSDQEVLDLKDDVKEIKGDVKDVAAAVNSLRILIAENYVTRKEFVDYKKDEKTSKHFWAGFVISAAALIMTLITFVSNALRGGAAH